jgi:hypothetical protein
MGGHRANGPAPTTRRIPLPHSDRSPLPAQRGTSKKAKPVLAKVTAPGVAKLLLAEGTTPEQMDAITDALIGFVAEPELAFVPQLAQAVYRAAHPKAEYRPWTMAQVEKRRKALRAEAKANGKGAAKAD